MGRRRTTTTRRGLLRLFLVGVALVSFTVSDGEATRTSSKSATATEKVSTASFNPGHKNAYATMMYMGTPRDYEFYVATRVMLRSLKKLGIDADLVVIASLDVPLRWVQTL